MRIILVIIALFFLCNVNAQTKNADHYNNALIFELGGHGLFYSVNYDRVLINGGFIDLHGQVGIAYYPPIADVLDWWFPILLTHHVFSGLHKLELGLGYSVVRESTRDVDNTIIDWNWTGFQTYRIGYRFDNPRKRYLLRIAYTPLVEQQHSSSETHHSGGISIGYQF